MSSTTLADRSAAGSGAVVPPLVLPELPIGAASVTSTIGRLREIAAVIGEHPALISPGRRSTFAEAVERAEAIGAEFRRRWVAVPDDRPVAVLAEQNVDSLLVVLGVMASGRPVVIADPLVPADRLAGMFHRAQVAVCLADDARFELGQQVLDAAAVLFGVKGRGPSIELQPLTELLAAPAAAPGPDLPGRRCVVFTSGSSGVPKAVTYSDGWLLNEALGAARALNLDAGDRAALVLPAAFAAGLTVFVMALLNGSTVCAYDPRLAGIRGLPEFLRRSGVTTVHTTPSLLRSLLGVLPPAGGLEGVRLVTTCGEAVHGRDIAALRKHLPPDAVYTSWSGSSETGHLAFHRIASDEPVPAGIVPVGRPAANKLVRLIDTDGSDVPPGAVGEVTVTSAYLCEGYLDDPAGTAERFVPLADGRNRYHMGDLGRFDADGTLHLLGRQDTALKIRGYLVEPAEVEGVLLTHPDIAEVVVIGHYDSEVGEAQGTVHARPPRLVAYVCPASRERSLSNSAIRRLLREKLPEWMIPSVIVQLAELPRNERGKIDRSALAPPAAPPAPEPARTAGEAMLIDIWCAVLDLPGVGRTSDFTELGGDSLDAEEMLAIVSDRLGVRLLTSDLAQAPTVEAFAARAAAVAARKPAAQAAPGGRRRSRSTLITGTRRGPETPGRRVPSTTMVTLRTADGGPVVLRVFPELSDQRVDALQDALHPMLPVVTIPRPPTARRWGPGVRRNRLRTVDVIARAMLSAQPRGPLLVLAVGAQAASIRLAARELAQRAWPVVSIVEPTATVGPSHPELTEVVLPDGWTTASGAAVAATRILAALEALPARR